MPPATSGTRFSLVASLAVLSGVVLLLRPDVVNTLQRSQGGAVSLAAAPAPTGLLEDPILSIAATIPDDEGTVTLSMSYLRWFWWPLILYLFWGMGYVCDVYFVRTIEVISERFHIPDDVAGATLMALGCNGPEMALNTIAIFKPSDIGIGAVIGGEVFNVLVIIGTAMLATPAAYLPLRLEAFSFMRDVIFYGLSVGLLYWVLQDGEVTRFNALVLLLGAVLYSGTVAMSAKLRCWCMGIWRSKEVRRGRRAIRRASRASVKVFNKSVKVDDEQDAADEESDKEEAEWAEKEKLDPLKVMNWAKASHCTDVSEGSVLRIRVDMRNRLMDLQHRSEERYMWLCEDALIVSTALDPHFGLRQKLGRSVTGTAGVVFDHDALSFAARWHHGGLVNRPTKFLRDTEGGGGLEPRPEKTYAPPPTLLTTEPQSEFSKPLLNEQRMVRTNSIRAAVECTPEMVDKLELRESPFEVIPLEDILYCENRQEHEGFTLHVHQHNDDLGQLMTLELNSDDAAVTNSWVEALRSSLKTHRRTTTEPPPQKAWLGLLMEWAEWLQFPVKFFLRLTVPDMDKPEMQHWYPMAFVMSMAWLALFAYGVTSACEGIHKGFGIPTALLGFTVAAAGTSFPNVFSGMVVSKQGKTSMAIANALGANVQNVFLALAVPWTIQTCFINHGPIQVRVENLMPSIIECAITILPVLGVYLGSNCSMPRWSGGLYLLTYLVYLVFALGQERTHCARWPFPC